MIQIGLLEVEFIALLVEKLHLPAEFGHLSDFIHAVDARARQEYPVPNRWREPVIDAEFLLHHQFRRTPVRGRCP